MLQFSGAELDARPARTRTRADPTGNLAALVTERGARSLSRLPLGMVAG